GLRARATAAGEMPTDGAHHHYRYQRRPPLRDLPPP
uniref:Uncharacterized protein n=1 Tax=Aegilops tauschii subsp. strangulata TaxID=200361 RepID=A0A453LIG5_AEGTS